MAFEKGNTLGKKFQPGESGNPAGRPKANKELQETARNYADEALLALAEILKDGSASPSARVAAAQALLDRGYGKPNQPMSNEDGSPLIPSSITVRSVSGTDGRASGEG